jgi:hypothetical protein
MSLQMTSAGLFGIAPQHTFETPGDSFHWFPLVNCDFGPLEGQDNLPPEVGGAALSRGRFKTGIVFGGNIDIVPRLYEDIGWLLHAALGDVSTLTDTTIAEQIAGGGGTEGVNSHRFGFKSTDEFWVPYVTAHKLLPHDTAASQVGEIAEDCRVTNWSLTAAPAAVVAMRFGLLGRATADTVWDLNPAWSADYDTEDTFMVTSCAGSIKLKDSDDAVYAEFDTGAVNFVLANNVLPPARARKIGSGHPIDFPVLSRAITLVTTCYVSSYDLYMQSFGGVATPVVDCNWSCIPYSGDFDITLQSAALIGATAEYYQMRIRTTQSNCNFMVRPIVLVPNQPVVFQLVATVQNPDSGRPIDVYLQNAISNYTWPTE